MSKSGLSELEWRSALVKNFFAYVVRAEEEQLRLAILASMGSLECEGNHREAE